MSKSISVLSSRPAGNVQPRILSSTASGAQLSRDALTPCKDWIDSHKIGSMSSATSAKTPS